MNDSPEQDMQPFIEMCKGELSDIESDFKEVEESFERVVEHFGEPISSTPEQLFGMVHRLCPNNSWVLCTSIPNFPKSRSIPL